MVSRIREWDTPGLGTEAVWDRGTVLHRKQVWDMELGRKQGLGIDTEELDRKQVWDIHREGLDREFGTGLGTEAELDKMAVHNFRSCTKNPHCS